MLSKIQNVTHNEFLQIFPIGKGIFWSALILKFGRTWELILGNLIIQINFYTTLLFDIYVSLNPPVRLL